MKGVTVTCVQFASKAFVEFFMTNLILKTIYFLKQALVLVLKRQLHYYWSVHD